MSAENTQDHLTEINRQLVQTPWDYNDWKEWQDYQKLSQSRKCGASIGSGIGICLSAATAFLLAYPEAIFAVPVIIAVDNIVVVRIEKETNKVGKGLGMIPMTKN